MEERLEGAGLQGGRDPPEHEADDEAGEGRPGQPEDEGADVEHPAEQQQPPSVDPVGKRAGRHLEDEAGERPDEQGGSERARPEPVFAHEQGVEGEEGDGLTGGANDRRPDRQVGGAGAAGGSYVGHGSTVPPRHISPPGYSVEMADQPSWASAVQSSLGRVPSAIAMTPIVSSRMLPRGTVMNAVSAASRPDAIRSIDARGARPVASTAHHCLSTQASTTAWKSIGDRPGA